MTGALRRFAAIPTELRVHGDPTLGGRGVVLAFVDGGFRSHPELAEPRARILDYADMVGTTKDLPTDDDADPGAWHGTQTTIVAAGSGNPDEGACRGLAHAAHLVLVNVGVNGRISDTHLTRGIRRVLARRETLGIRVLNLSIGGDRDIGENQSDIVQAVEDAVAAGITVVVAAGNAGCGPRPRVMPPASAPSAITVGGLDDGNRLDGTPEAYCSSFGPSLDGVIKPEVVAPAAHVAAPIRPGTPMWHRADALAALDETPDYELAAAACARCADVGLPEDFPFDHVDLVRAACADAARALRLVGRKYQHVDGTSFAAPIVTSIVAQMLEVDPTLTPAEVKRILMATARHVTGVHLRRQGFGSVDARRALDRVRAAPRDLTSHHFRAPAIRDGRLRLHLHDLDATAVSVAGPFNGWGGTPSHLTRDAAGVWTIDLDAADATRIPYKFIINGVWRGDPSNPRAEDDGHSGENSVAEAAR